VPKNGYVVVLYLWPDWNALSAGETISLQVCSVTCGLLPWFPDSSATTDFPTKLPRLHIVRVDGTAVQNAHIPHHRDSSNAIVKDKKFDCRWAMRFIHDSWALQTARCDSTSSNIVTYVYDLEFIGSACCGTFASKLVSRESRLAPRHNRHIRLSIKLIAAGRYVHCILRRSLT